MEYVLGFLFDKKGEKVLLIEKNRPAWQAGFLNGVGGKIEPNETPIQAMVREFKEEAFTVINDWCYFASIKGEDFKIYCYMGFGPLDEIKRANDEKVKTPMDEELFIIAVNDILANKVKCISNIPLLVYSALHNTIEIKLDYPGISYAFYPTAS